MTRRAEVRIVRRSRNTGRVLKVIQGDDLFCGDREFAENFLDGFGRRTGCTSRTTNAIQVTYHDNQEETT